MKKIYTYISYNETRVLIILTLFTLIIRLLYFLIRYLNNGITDANDSLLYIDISNQMAQGNWLIDMIVAPAIPILAVVFTKLFSDPHFPFIFFNIIMSALIVPVLYYLGKELFSSKIGWMIAAWGIVFEDYFKRIIYILKEPTINLLIPLTILLLIISVKSNSKIRFVILSAISFSWLIHTDERFFAYFPFFILFFFCIKPFVWKKSFLLSAVWTGIVLFLMLPWGIRNYQVYDQVVILTTRTTAFTSKLWGEDISKLHFTDNTPNVLANTSTYEANEFGKQYGITPREYGKRESRFRAFINFWQPTYFRATYIQYGFRPEIWSLFHNIKSIFYYGIFLPFYLIGIFFLIKRRYYLGLLIALIPIIHSLMHAYMVWPLERYRSPITFIVVMIGMWAIQQLYISYCFRNGSASNTSV